MVLGLVTEIEKLTIVSGLDQLSAVFLVELKNEVGSEERVGVDAVQESGVRKGGSGVGQVVVLLVNALG